MSSSEYFEQTPVRTIAGLGTLLISALFVPPTFAAPSLKEVIINIQFESNLSSEAQFPRHSRKMDMKNGLGCRRRFAPLDPSVNASNLPKLDGIVFDVDGTLCMFI
jgi:hypothetical protein